MGACSTTPEPQEAPPQQLRPGPKRSLDTLYKILLIGDSSVGKSSMILRFSDNQFSDAFISTVGVDFKIRDFEIDSDVVKLQIWDTAGQERFRTITSSFFRGAHAIVIVYDITKPNSLLSVAKWLEEIERAAPQNVKKVLVGNKSDLVKERQVEYGEGKALAQERGMEFFETSAKDATNIKEVFGCVARLVHHSSA